MLEAPTLVLVLEQQLKEGRRPCPNLVVPEHELGHVVGLSERPGIDAEIVNKRE